MKKKNPAAVALGRKGGQKKVPKGFAKASPEKRAIAARKSQLTRWLNSGKEKTFFVRLAVTCDAKWADMLFAYGRSNSCETPPDLVGAEVERVVLHAALANPLFETLRLQVAGNITVYQLSATQTQGWWGHSGGTLPFYEGPKYGLSPEQKEKYATDDKTSGREDWYPGGYSA